jgi:hypothetical protein
MDCARWQRLQEHFDAAVELTAPQRASLIAQIGTADVAMAEELASLLAAHDASSEFLTAVATASLPADVRPDTLAPGARIGVWRVGRLVGRGGMGEVYEAHRVDAPFEQKAALKVMRPEAAQFIERFRVERQILARLDHPGIARLLDGGATDDGRHYAVMEFVEGEPITQYCETRCADLQARIDLLLQVCDAVAHAHRNLIVHRDLKPGNVIVDADGRARLLDFGIAKPLDVSVNEETQAALLTPDYAAPEQLCNEPITTATDVYALGALAFELLTAEKPWPIEQQTLARALHTMLERVAPRPSQIASQAATPPVPAKALRGDVDAIIDKCLRIEPGDRYATVEALRDDFVRFLQGRVVLARAGSRRYRAVRFLKRYRLPVAASAVVLLAIVAGGATALWQARLAGEEAHRAEAVQDFLISIFRANTENQPDPIKARDTTARELLAVGAARLEQDRTLPPAARERLLDVMGRLYTEMDLRETAATLNQQRIAELRRMGDRRRLAQSLLEFAENVQETNRRDEALDALREAETLIFAQRPIDEALAGTVYSYLSNQVTTSDHEASLRYARAAVTHLRRAKPVSEEMVGALFMLFQAESSENPIAAEAAAAEAVDVVEKIHGSEHSLYGDAVMFLADIESILFKNDAAETKYRLTESIVLRSADPHQYQRLQLDLRFGSFLVEIGRIAEGRARLQRVLDTAIATRGRDDRRYVAWAHEYVAKADFQRGLLDSARQDIRRSIEIRRTVAPSDLLAKSVELSFDIEMAMGEFDAAEALLAEARAAREVAKSATQAGFQQGLELREAQLALARNDHTRAAQLFGNVIDAGVPPLPQFQRYWLDAWIGRSRISLAKGDTGAATRDAQRALTEIERLGSPAQLKLNEAEAWEQLGAVHARAADCASASAAWEKSRAALTTVSDAASYRFANLQRARAACRP